MVAIGRKWSIDMLGTERGSEVMILDTVANLDSEGLDKGIDISLT